jgi:hypothetical protein
MNLSDVLKKGYENQEQQQKYFADNNYIRDNQLSTEDNQAYFNEDENKLLFNVTGSHRFSDYYNPDRNLIFGNLQQSQRYKESDKLLKEAKKKYNKITGGELNTTVIGHSLGGSIGSLISSPSDTVYTLDKGATIGSKIRNHENAFRSDGDFISILNKNSKHMHTLQNPNLDYEKDYKKFKKISYIPRIRSSIYSHYNAHDIKNIKDSGIFI